MAVLLQTQGELQAQYRLLAADNALLARGCAALRARVERLEGGV